MLIRIQVKKDNEWVTLIEGNYDGEVRALSEVEAHFIPANPRIVGGIIKVEKVEIKEEGEDVAKEEPKRTTRRSTRTE